MQASTLTPDQVITLAPDAASAKAGRDLAQARRWVTLGRQAASLWGECQGSAAKPYQTQVNMAGPRFHCSCPSRKFPCKHVLGLLLLFAVQPELFPMAQPPAWVEARPATRTDREQRHRTTVAERPAANGTVADPEAKARRAAERAARVAAGLDELERWLGDLARGGLGAAQEQPPRYWESMAARLVDAQAPGLARLLREASSVAGSGPGWPERLAERLGRLYLLVQGYQRLKRLPAPIQADVRALAGWAVSLEEVLAGPAIHDRWLVLGQRHEVEERLRVRRTWLWGERTRQAALLLDFAAPGQGFEGGLAPGTGREAALAFYPSAYPLRAVLTESGPTFQAEGLPGYASLEAAAAAFGRALAAQPWIERFPVPLQTVVPMAVDEQWWVRDPAGQAWPLAPRFDHAWALLALSGGRPLDVFGEWDGYHLWPLSAWAEGRFADLSPVLA